LECDKKEKQIFKDLLTCKREAVVALLNKCRAVLRLRWSDMGCLSINIEVPIKIKVMEHKPLTLKPMPYAKTEYDALREIVKEKINNGKIEYSKGPYANRYF
jgi:hypothetical protein